MLSGGIFWFYSNVSARVNSYWSRIFPFSWRSWGFQSQIWMPRLSFNSVSVYVGMLLKQHWSLLGRSFSLSITQRYPGCYGLCLPCLIGTQTWTCLSLPGFLCQNLNSPCWSPICLRSSPELSTCMSSHGQWIEDAKTDPHAWPSQPQQINIFGLKFSAHFPRSRFHWNQQGSIKSEHANDWVVCLQVLLASVNVAGCLGNNVSYMHMGKRFHWSQAAEMNVHEMKL